MAGPSTTVTLSNGQTVTLGQLVTQIANQTHYTVNGQQQTLNPALLAAIVQNESGWNVGSTQGAANYTWLGDTGSTGYGLGQLTTTGLVQQAIALSPTGSVWDPQANLTVTAQYLASLLSQLGGNLQYSIAGYNAGGGAAANAMANGTPPSAITYRPNYVANVLAAMQTFGGSGLGTPTNSSQSTPGGAPASSGFNLSSLTSIPGTVVGDVTGFLGGVFGNVTGTAGNILNAGGSAVSNVTSIPAAIEGLPAEFGSVGAQVGGTLAQDTIAGVTGALSAIGQRIGKWLALAALTIAILIVLDQLVLGGRTTQVMTQAAAAGAA